MGAKQWKLQKRGDALRTTLVLKIGLKKFLSINFHQKMSQCISIRIFRNQYYHLASRIPPKLLYLGCAMEKTAR
jgi:hypothetical protein